MKILTTVQTIDNALEQFYQKLLKSPAAQAQLKTGRLHLLIVCGA